jgi:sirohydrochlorin ferrochelatase
MNALILFSHGSLLCGSGGALEQHARRFRKSKTWDIVEIGYLNYSLPTFADAVERCYSAGARAIAISPYFLVSGYFVTHSLPKCINAAKKDYPDLNFVTAEAIGFDPTLADIILENALNPLEPDQWRRDLTEASLKCRVNPECPLYGTASCALAPAEVG